MSRFSDDYNEEFPGQLELYRANVDRALAGKRGQKALREMREALLALPERKLIVGALCAVEKDEEDKPVKPIGFCAIGAFALRRRLAAGQTMQQIMEDMEQDPSDEEWENEQGTIDEGEAQGLARILAWELAWVNDEGLNQWRENITEEERFTRYLAWLDKHIKPEEVPA